MADIDDNFKKADELNLEPSPADAAKDGAKKKKPNKSDARENDPKLKAEWERQ